MKKRLVTIFCILLCLSVGCAELVFVREDGGTRRIYKMRDNGTSVQLFSPNTATTYSYPDVSPNGDKIAYTDGQNVFISNLGDIGGSSEQQLSTPPGTKSWIRWATQHPVVAYANRDTVSNRASIFLSATSGVNFLQATFPTVSQSDGFGHDFYLNNNVQDLVYSRNGDLYSMFYNGTQPPTQITNTPAIMETLPVVSHDGRLMAYRISIQLMPTGTRDTIRIVDVGSWSGRYAFELQPPVAKGTISAIAFSCDDKRLYIAAKTASTSDNDREIFSVKLDGSDQKQVTNNTVLDSYPDAVLEPCW